MHCLWHVENTIYTQTMWCICRHERDHQRMILNDMLKDKIVFKMFLSLGIFMLIKGVIIIYKRGGWRFREISWCDFDHSPPPPPPQPSDAPCWLSFNPLSMISFKPNHTCLLANIAIYMQAIDSFIDSCHNDQITV